MGMLYTTKQIFFNFKFLLVLLFFTSLVCAAHTSNAIRSSGMFSYEAGLWKHEGEVVKAPVLYTRLKPLVKLRDDDVNASMCEVQVDHENFQSVFDSNRNTALNFVWIMALASSLMLTVMFCMWCQVWVMRTRRVLGKQSEHATDAAGPGHERHSREATTQGSHKYGDDDAEGEGETAKLDPPLRKNSFVTLGIAMIVVVIMMSLAAIVITAGLSDTCHNLPKDGCYVECCTCEQQLCINEQAIFAGREGQECEQDLDLQRIHTLSKSVKAARGANTSAVVAILCTFVAVICLWMMQKRSKDDDAPVEEGISDRANDNSNNIAAATTTGSNSGGGGGGGGEADADAESQTAHRHGKTRENEEGSDEIVEM